MRELLQSLRGRPAPVLPNIDSTGEASRMLDAILRAAANEGASDIHFEPKEGGLLVRFRLDGEMRDHTTVALAQRDALLSRGKIFGGMDITERRLPQDGRATLKEGGRRYHLRLSTVPTVYGENLVVRLLDQTMPAQSLDELGLTSVQAQAIARCADRSGGIDSADRTNGFGKDHDAARGPACLGPPRPGDPHIGGPGRI
jgi:type II secretory ATPase GspE/PulE/Tfp pilus assembly ATPase PilB-like protein